MMAKGRGWHRDFDLWLGWILTAGLVALLIVDIVRGIIARSGQ